MHNPPYTGPLLLTFSRDGEEEELRVALTGFDAVSPAMAMLSLNEMLRTGDKLTVLRGATADTPIASRARGDA